jgi:hypothetical protein
MTCLACVPAKPITPELETLEELADESHFGVSIRQCVGCKQLFVSVFCERIDWQEGNDSQYTALVPISRDEADRLRAQRDRVSEDYLDQLGSDRTWLRWWWPSDGTGHYEYTTGPTVVAPHD